MLKFKKGSNKNEAVQKIEGLIFDSFSCDLLIFKVTKDEIQNGI